MPGHGALVGPLSEEDGGSRFVTVPMLPGWLADGGAEALRGAEGAVRAWTETAMELGRAVPTADVRDVA